MTQIRSFTALLALLVVGCGGSSSSTGAGSSGVDQQQQGLCANETRSTPFHVNLAEKSDSGNTTVTIVDAAPALPAMGKVSDKYNVWTLSVTDASGKPVTNASISISPYMPDHRHYSPITPVITSKGDGTYVAESIEFSMEGFWQVVVTVKTGAASEDVLFPICVE